MKIKRVLTTLLASMMIITSSVNVFAAEDEAYKEFKVADKVIIGGNERGVNLIFGEGELLTAVDADGTASAYAKTTTYSGKRYHLEAQVACVDQLDYYTSSKVSKQDYAISVSSDTIRPYSSFGGEFIGQHKITSPSTGESHYGGTSTVMS